MAAHIGGVGMIADLWPVALVVAVLLTARPFFVNKTVCAWCKRTLKRGYSGKVSHGICAKCKSEMMGGGK